MSDSEDQNEIDVEVTQHSIAFKKDAFLVLLRFF
jgi:hypothetical protein